jgi:hypothetical protein
MHTLTVQELAIVIAVKNLDPTLITPDFLRYTRIVPTEWQMVGQPLRGPQGSQVSFQNGVTIVAQPQRVSFVELLINKGEFAVDVPGIARCYIDTLPNMEYIGVGINVRGFIKSEDQPESSRNYIVSRLLAPGQWQNAGIEPIQAGLNLGYTFEGKRLNLNINEGMLQDPENNGQIPIVIFSGNFDYNLDGSSLPEQLSKLHETIDNWSSDVDIFKDTVEKFTS